ncbi:TlpA family protein disulfide reductase [Flavobacterium sp. MFBS3-15]|uniref:TlpA family protein disulfide reductase n=1 Tax=Flavobacterium sp. MFBS3-15 TaxID=2989816 RepID=UPI002235B310|nr:TlpA disulfide reductase family protein [Flavobacterium sp. MFBS3-15]MCW4469731.1 TlpA family protein disulfide reductase [Flavobacterium sp. MFBS3-15]
MKNILFILLFVFNGALAQTNVRFIAKIENRNSDTLVLQRVEVDGLQYKIFRVGMVSDADGNFQGTFLMEPALYRLFDGKEQATIYLEEGYDLKMEMDAKMFDETISFKGRGAEENNYLAKKFLLFEEARKNVAQTTDKAVFKTIVRQVMDRLWADLDNERLSKKFRKIMNSELFSEKTELEKIFNHTVSMWSRRGKPSPDFNCENHKGGTTSLKDLKGKYVYIDVWATWCGPCLQEIPSLQKLEQVYRDRNIEFVSLSVDAKKDYDKWRKMVTDKSLMGIQLFSGKGFELSFIRKYLITSIPRFILIDPSGNIVDADAKKPSDPALAEQLNNLLD